jgi:hypothetical protein
MVGIYCFYAVRLLKLTSIDKEAEYDKACGVIIRGMVK